MPAPGNDTASRDLRDQLQRTLGGDYELERELTGRMARVFVAVQRSLGRRVVVKVLPPSLASGLSVERFRREVLVAARLHHPHIVGVLTAGETAGDGLPYYTMPYVEGESLRARLAREGALPVRTAMRILRGVAEALAHAHDHGVVHRDIKPENVLLVGDSALVTDFGVAKGLAAAASDDGQRPEHASVTASGMLVGTPLYLAPEQAAGDPAIDHRADLYALGLLAYELLTGAPPFAARTPQQLVAAHIAEQPEPLAVRHPGVPPALAHLVMRCLAKQPADRPQSAAEVLDALESVPASASGAEAVPDRSRAAGGGPRPRWRRLAALVGGSAALGLAVAGGVMAARDPREPALDRKRVLVAGFDNESGDSTLDPVGRMAADWLAQGLAQTGAVEVISSSSITGALAGQADPRGGGGGASGLTAVRELARQSRSGTVIWGAYYRHGDSLRLQAQITDVNTGRIVVALEPVVGPVANPVQPVDALRQRVMGAVAASFDNAGGFQIERYTPPTYAAYREWSAGLDHFLRQDYAASIPHFRRAAELDSTLAQALVWAAAAYGNLGDPARRDSVTALVARSRDRLLPADRDALDWLQARGNTAAALRIVRRAAARDSNWVHIYLHGLHARDLNRPRETVEVLGRLADSSYRAAWVWPPYWIVYASAHHMLGDYEAELAVARRGRAAMSDRPGLRDAELRALAALGRLDEVRVALDEVQTLTQDLVSAPGGTMFEAAQELRAHGHPALAREAARQAADWYASRPADELRRVRDRGINVAQALYESGRLDEARALCEQLAAADTANVSYRGLLGAIAARQGDRAGAERASAWLAQLTGPYLDGLHTYYRARIAAVLGDREQAVALLARAFEQGRRYSVVPHRELDFEGLRDYPPFQALLKPRG